MTIYLLDNFLRIHFENSQSNSFLIFPFWRLTFTYDRDLCCFDKTKHCICSCVEKKLLFSCSVIRRYAFLNFINILISLIKSTFYYTLAVQYYSARFVFQYTYPSFEPRRMLSQLFESGVEARNNNDGQISTSLITSSRRTEILRHCFLK